MIHKKCFSVALPLNGGSIKTFNDAWNLVWELNYQFNARSGYCEKNRYQNHLQNSIGNLKLSDITPLLLDTLKAKMLASGRRAQTVKHVLNLIKGIFNYLIKYNLFSGENPARKVSMPIEDRTRQRYLTKEEADLLLSALRCKSEQLWQMSLLSLSTGMRASEIFHLKGEHIDLAMRTIRIIDPKSGRNRSVYLPNSAWEMLCKCDLKNGHLIFPNKFGEPYKAINRVFYKTVQELGLNKGLTDPRDYVVFHSLRHTFASWLVQKDQPIYVVSELLGHSSLMMTKRYAHLSPARQVAATSVLNSFL